MNVMPTGKVRGESGGNRDDRHVHEKARHPGGPFVARMYAGKDATAEFGDFHSKLAEKHMAHFCVGELSGD